MAKAVNISKEEAEFLAAEKVKKQKNELPSMKQLAINVDKVDDEGQKIDPDTWHIRGEKQYTDTVSFRPLRYKQKFIRMNQNEKKQWRTDNESIFVEGFEPAYDVRGGLACGRLIGKLPEHWTEEQRQANFKKATIYGFLFGLVTLPGGEPTLVNFRAAPAKATVIREAISTRSLGGDEMYRYDFTMQLVPKKGEKFVTLTMVPTLNNKHDSISDVLPYIKEIDSYIESHNNSIMKKREGLLERLKAIDTYKEVRSLATDFDDLEDPAFTKGLSL